MGEVLLYALSFVLGIAVPAAVVRQDMQELRGEALARAWPDASLWSAVVIFGPLSVPIHFLRTRRSWVGLGLAVFWFICTLLLVGLPVEALARLFHVEP